MTLIKRIHCVLDREPESYHAAMAPPLGVHALNLNLECELAAPGLPSAADETEAKAAYAQFLQAIGAANAVAFYAYRIVQDGAAWRAEMPEPVSFDRESSDRSDPRLLLDWLAEHPGRNGHWTVPSQQAGGEGLVTIKEADAHVTHLLRASQFWSAPVAHQFGLTHVVGLPDDAAPRVVLAVPQGETPPATLAATLPTSDVSLWELLLPSWGGLGDVLFRTNQLQMAPQVMPDFLDSAGYLKVNPDAGYMRRVLDWFERGWAGLLSNGPALLGTLAKADPTRFEPSWTPFPEQAPRSSTLTAPEARWLAMSGLCAGLDPIIVALTRPASERRAEGQILAALVTHLLEAFTLRPSAHVPQDAAGMAAGLRLLLSNSVLLRKHDPATPADPAEMSNALRAVYDIRGGAGKSVAAQILDMLLTDPKDLVELDETSVRRLAREVSKDAAAQPLGFAEDPFDQVLEHVHTLNAERGSEAAIIRLFESAAGAASVPDAIWNQLCPAAGPATPEERQEALVTVLGAWQNFLAQLNDSFNGAEAVRRSASADFAQALVAFYLANDTKGGKDAGAQIVAHAREADYFATRLLGRSANLHCFDGLADTLPRLKPDAPKLNADIEAIRAGLTAFYQEAIAPIAMLDPASIRFVADMAPRPLPIQISAQADAEDLDRFATDFNGIGLAVRRLDKLAGVPDRWAHAQLAEFDLYEAKPAKADDAAAPRLEGIRQWMPPPPDGRAPIFLDYNGFPLASQAATSAGSDPAAAQLYRRPPFYAADVTSPDGFAQIPRLAYGRRFEAFSFATTNAGNLPLALQKSADEPWLPRADFGPSAADVYEASYQRRTAVGAVSIDEAPGARKTGSAIAGVRPLSSDYPRTALLSSDLAPGVVDLMAEADGAGTLFFSTEPNDASMLVDLTDVEWSGAARRLTLQFFDRAAEPGATTEFEIPFDGVSADTFSTDPRISIWLESTFVPASDGVPEAWLRTFRAKVGSLLRPSSRQVPTAGGWWVRIILDQGELASLSFAEPRSNSDPARRAAPLLLLAPPGADKDKWLKGVVTHHGATIRAPRVGYLDFERWSANGDNLAAMFPDAAAGRQLLDDLLELYVTRGAQPEAHAPSDVDVNAARAQDSLSMLPDPAVNALLVELICIDSLSGDKVAVAPRHIPLHDILGQIAEAHDKAIEADGKSKARAVLLGRIDRAFSFELTIESLTSTAESALTHPKMGPVTVRLPAGRVAELRVSPVVADAHFQALGGHPPVIHKGIKQMARRRLAPGMLAYPAAAIRIETMLDALVPSDRAQDLVDAMIACRAIDRARRYDIVVLGSASPAHRQDWRLLGKIAISTQRWRPSGRPIYNHIDPGQHVPKGRQPARLPNQAALQLLLPTDPGANQGLSLFEAEAFFARRDGDAETIPYDLPPLVASSASRVGIEPAATVLQDIAWDASSATYFRHRFELHSRYAAALPRPRRSIPAWNASEEMEDTPHAWSMRVAILADSSRVDLTRPQLRALMPLTTAPDQEAERMDATPPVLAYLQEPPFTGGGLADRIGAEIKTGFGYGFEAGSPVGILDARKEIGPDPRLSYRAMSKDRALGMALRVEGPIGLTFDSPDATAPRFANASLSLSPVSVAGPAAASMEEHFLGVSLRRYLDPGWVAAPSGDAQAPTISQTQWLEFDSANVANGAILLGYAGHTEHALITISVVDGVRYVTAATEEIDAGGSKAGRPNVCITALPAGSGRVAILHGGTVPGRYSASIFAVDIEDGADVAAGKSNQPLLLASFEWSPVIEKIKRDNGDSKKPVPFKLVPLAGATTRPTVSSAPTFMAWTRTSRDFERTWLARVERHEGLDQFAAIQVDCNALSARFGGGQDATTLSIGRENAEATGEWLCSSTFAIEHPIHVHRHLAVLGTRYAAGKGRPMEVFAGAELAGTSQIQIPQNSPLLVASSVRIVEFETPASIICAAPALVPEAYKAAYLDLKASGGRPDRALKLFVRFVRPVSHVSKFSELQVRLSPVDDADGAAAAGFVDIILTDLAEAAGLEVNILGASVTAAWVSARGIKTELKATAIVGNFALATDSPGFLVKLAAKGGPGEFWADISLLHSAPPTGQQSPDRFDFHWLFSAADADLAAAIKPSALAVMEEAQARIISVSPPIRVQ